MIYTCSYLEIFQKSHPAVIFPAHYYFFGFQALSVPSLVFLKAGFDSFTRQADTQMANLFSPGSGGKSKND